MNKKNVFKNILNQKGLSMVETIVGAGLLAGVAWIGMNQSDLMKKVSRDTQIQQNSIDLGGQITALLMGQDACEANFGGGSMGVGSSVTAIKNEAGLVAFEQGQTYLNNSIKIENMQIVGSASGGNLELKVDYEKQGEFVGMKNFSQRLPLLVETDDSGNIQNCFSFSSSIQNTIRDILAKKLCQNNQGEHDPDGKTCYVRGIDPAGIKCDAFGEGYSLIRITYEKDNPGPDGKLMFMGECAKKFEPKNCDGWVRSVSSAGKFECDSIGNHISGLRANPHNANCGLDVSGGKLVFACSGGGPSQCSGCSAPPANEICDGNSVNGVDSCGNFCTVEGTKTEGCGGCGECGDPALVCENQDVTDDCGNVCGTGTKTEGCGLTCEDDGGQIFAGNCAEAAASGYPNSSGSISSDQCCSGNAQVYAYCPPDNQGEVEVTCGADGDGVTCTQPDSSTICVGEPVFDSCENQVGEGTKPKVDGEWGQYSEWGLIQHDGDQVMRSRSCMNASCGGDCEDEEPCRDEYEDGNDSCPMTDIRVKDCAPAGTRCSKNGMSANEPHCNTCCSGADNFDSPGVGAFGTCN